MMRFFYTLIKAITHAGKLKSLGQTRLNTVLEISPAYLHEADVSVLVLDFDGVLNAHGELFPREDVQTWLKALMDQYPRLKVAILSNKPLEARKSFFGEHFSSIEFVSAKKKPYPDGLIQITQKHQVRSNQVLLVDDRILTGMLACALAQCQGVLIHKPYTNMRKRPVKELFFASLRALERLFF